MKLMRGFGAAGRVTQCEVRLADVMALCVYLRGRSHVDYKDEPEQLEL